MRPGNRCNTHFHNISEHYLNVYGYRYIYIYEENKRNIKFYGNGLYLILMCVANSKLWANVYKTIKNMHDKITQKCNYRLQVFQFYTIFTMLS